MKKGTNHIIKTQSIEISFEDIEDSVGIQSHIAEVFYEKLQPRINAMFDEIAGEKYLMTIDRLEIDTGILSNKNWEEEWVERTIRKLKDELLTRTKRPVEESFGYSEEMVAHFFFFLEHGHLPWNGRPDTLGEIEAGLPFSAETILQLKQLINRMEAVSERLVYSFSADFRDRLLRSLAAGKTPAGEKIYAILYNETAYWDPVFQIMALKVLATEKSGEDIHTTVKNIRQRYQELLQKSDAQTKENESEIRIRKHPYSKEAEEIFIDNAGLIILHPFLSSLFEKAGLMKDNTWLYENASDTAVMLLQYLATGIDKYAEYDFPFNKILCGIAVDDIVKEVKLDNAMKEECQLLLADVISYWSVLKNTGTEALRETFLQRNGKLTKTDDGWLLLVEQTAIDILLSSLPWGIGTIKLPWMVDIIYTEWT